MSIYIYVQKFKACCFGHIFTAKAQMKVGLARGV